MNNLPIIVLEEIFLQVVHVSDEELQKLRQVCKAWNKIIKTKLLGKNPSAEWGKIIASRIKKRTEFLEIYDNPLSVAEVTCTARLAHQGHLDSAI